MTALQWIIKEAKAIRSKSPKMEWKKAVAQASAIYASKHKGKSPVGKKKVVKKAAKKVAKKKAVGKYVKTVRSGKITDVIYKRKKISGVKKKAVKKTATKKATGKHIDTKSHNVNIKVMSGIGAVNKHALKQYDELLNKINKVEKHIVEYTRMSKDMGYNLDNRKSFKLSASKWKKYLSELKTHAKELKKHI